MTEEQSEMRRLWGQEFRLDNPLSYLVANSLLSGFVGLVIGLGINAVLSEQTWWAVPILLAPMLATSLSYAWIENRRQLTQHIRDHGKRG